MSSPLLLDDPAEETDKNLHKADNQACYVCRANYQEEKLGDFCRISKTPQDGKLRSLENRGVHRSVLGKIGHVERYWSYL